MPERLHRPAVRGWQPPENAVYVGQGSKWATPFRYRSREALARVPALDGSAWEYEDRISAAGMSHNFFHPDGHMTFHEIRYMTREECNELYRRALIDPTWGIHLRDWTAEYDPDLKRIPWLKIEDARRELAGKDLACRCSLRSACHADVLLELGAKEMADAH
jgi:hypothetical protein